MKIPQWVAPVVMLGAIATVVLAAPFAANEHHNSPGWTYAGVVNTHPGCEQFTVNEHLAKFRCADGASFSLTAP